LNFKYYQELMLKLKLNATYLSSLVVIAFVLQIFIFSYLFTLNIKKDSFIDNFSSQQIKLLVFKNIKGNLNKEDIKNVNLLKSSIFKDAKNPAIISLSAYFLPFLLILGFRKRVEKEAEDNKRGMRLVEPKEVRKILNNLPSYFKIGGYDKKIHLLLDEDKEAMKKNKVQENIYRNGAVQVPIKYEVLHFLIIGRTGSGKTVLLKPILKDIKERYDRALVHDFKGDYLRAFYDKDMDLVLNPFSDDSIKWTIFNEIENSYDIDLIAASLIPEPKSSEDPFWKLEARKVFKGALQYLIISGQKTNKSVYDFFTQSNEQIKECFLNYNETIKYSHLFTGKDSKTAQSVMSVTRQYVDIFEMLKNIDGDFCLRDWCQNGNGIIFVTNRPDIKDAIKPLISMFFDLSSKFLLAEDDRNDRTFFMLDELGMLQKLNSIIDLLTNGRSKGVSTFVGIQEPAQISNIYGKELKNTILNATTNVVLFGMNDAQSAKELSQLIGESEEQFEDESIHHKIDSQEMDGYNIRKHLKTNSLVLASEIQSLKDRECYVKIANTPWTKTKIYINKTV